jgi:hypothetical protein
LLLLGVAVERAVGWTELPYRINWEYRLHLAPRFWPRDTFTKEAWLSSSTTERYRFIRDLLDRDLLTGKTEKLPLTGIGAASSRLWFALAFPILASFTAVVLGLAAMEFRVPLGDAPAAISDALAPVLAAVAAFLARTVARRVWPASGRYGWSLRSHG